MPPKCFLCSESVGNHHPLRNGADFLRALLIFVVLVGLFKKVQVGGVMYDLIAQRMASGCSFNPLLVCQIAKM